VGNLFIYSEKVGSWTMDNVYKIYPQLE